MWSRGARPSGSCRLRSMVLQRIEEVVDVVVLGEQVEIALRIDRSTWSSSMAMISSSLLLKFE